MLKQLSIYAENKKGTVQHITGILAEQGINILCELQPSAPDGRWQRASVPVQRCRVFGARRPAPW